ncbi:HPr family phosphocarrier protein [Caproiciproducens sp. CPB-2]|uniref:HPr family phosphocarrier protein n=1 Tax=Caproiciproducens sp. CPB-2 TaxID=3030017 RepID=UPI0023DC27C5|nr:HPr family phosphocarrier protein [Caproiciproducens sp. CPB-2]MDF1493638.1 HPr family phosphocarrier protein [Caproiciproducens sp. CPB-2]
MIKFDYTIQDKLGLHARPAGMLVKIAQGSGCKISVLANGTTADAKRLFSIMSLCAKENDRLTFAIEGEDEQTETDRLKAFCKQNL